MKCALCGYSFDQTDLVCHVQCPLADGCAIICCPNCGYQVVDESKSGTASLVRKVQKLFSEQPGKLENASPRKDGK